MSNAEALLRKEKARETFEKVSHFQTFTFQKDAGFALLILKLSESGLVASRGARLRLTL
jgi:hypothetical protein